MMSVNEISQIEDQFGLNTSTRGNMTSYIYVRSVVDITKSRRQNRFLFIFCTLYHQSYKCS